MRVQRLGLGHRAHCTGGGPALPCRTLAAPDGPARAEQPLEGMVTCSARRPLVRAPNPHGRRAVRRTQPSRGACATLLAAGGARPGAARARLDPFRRSWIAAAWQARDAVRGGHDARRLPALPARPLRGGPAGAERVACRSRSRWRTGRSPCAPSEAPRPAAPGAGRGRRLDRAARRGGGAGGARRGDRARGAARDARRPRWRPRGAAPTRSRAASPGDVAARARRGAVRGGGDGRAARPPAGAERGAARAASPRSRFRGRRSRRPGRSRVPLLAGAGHRSRRARRATRRPGEVASLLLFALGVAAALFALARGGLSAAAALARGEGEPARRRWLAATARGRRRPRALVAAAVASLPRAPTGHAAAPGVSSRAPAARRPARRRARCSRAAPALGASSAPPRRPRRSRGIASGRARSPSARAASRRSPGRRRSTAASSGSATRRGGGCAS